MNLLFSSNWQKTELFAPVAERLEKKGFGIVWQATSPHYTEYLISRGVPSERILRLRRDEAAAMAESELDFALLEKLEARTGQTVKNFMLMDRQISHWSWCEAHRYAAYLVRKISDFLDEYHVQVMFGEPATYHELISWMICEATGRTYIAPFSMRLPVNRFMCWDGPYETRFKGAGALRQQDVKPESLDWARDVRERVAEKRERPFYWYRNNTAPKLNAGYVKRIVRGVGRAMFGSRVDSNMYSLRAMLKGQRFHMRPFYYWTAKIRWSKIFDQPAEGERYVLYPLPKQPEYTVDVLAGRFRDQYQTLLRMARYLPSNMRLYVKEHRNSLGDRSVSELMAIKNLPGVRLIDPMADIHELILNSEMVVTPAGTASLEAALHGKPAYTLAGSFMNGFSTCEQLQGPWEVGERLNRPPVHDPEQDIYYLAWLLENSFEGAITDGTGPENHEAIAAGIEHMLAANFAEDKQLLVAQG